MQWRDSVQIRRALETVFHRVLTQRMAGLPVLNPELKVQALEFQCHQINWAGMLVTPWFMNLMLLPKAGAHWPSLAAGDKILCGFPAGEFEFILAHEPELGAYAACSLYSPMFQFDRQAVAVAAAQAAWRALFMEGETSARTLPKSISRRNLLRGAIAAGKNET
ncbi:MAG: [NiFe]-hydrogenase assembly chaperone HybE [Gammaproteobacteria bacterium]